MIAFLQPLALLGLAAAAIPVLLHFLSRRVPPTVAFPAARYLQETEREQSKRLKLRHLLLLLLRTALILCVVLAAARPIVPLGLGVGHSPTALGMVIDNSLSSAAIVEGRRTLDRLVEQAAAILQRLTDQDQLWLMLADGVVRRSSRLEALELVRELEPLPRRLDLGEGVRTMDRVLAGTPLAQREIVVLSDLQRSAWSSGESLASRVLLWRPEMLPSNRSVDSARAEPPVWGSSGAVVVSLGGDSSVLIPVSLELNGREVARSVGRGGDRVVMTASGLRPGWYRGLVRIGPDELRLDDEWHLALKVSEPAAAEAEPGAGRYVVEAMEVLEEGGRIRSGGRVVLSDRIGGMVSVVFPPRDPALVGNLNRQLARRGVALRFGDRLEGEWRADLGASADLELNRRSAWITVHRRHRLSGEGVVLARAGGEPWIVRAGDVVLVASRWEEDWTDLPVSAWFIPFLDYLVNRWAAGSAHLVNAAPGEVVRVPVGAAGIRLDGGTLAADPEGRMTAPLTAGVYFLRGESGDTVGALQVNHDPRESRLEPLDARLARGILGSQARLVGGRALDRDLFGGARRTELTAAFLFLALGLAGAELLAASLGTGRRRSGE